MLGSSDALAWRSASSACVMRSAAMRMSELPASACSISEVSCGEPKLVHQSVGQLTRCCRCGGRGRFGERLRHVDLHARLRLGDCAACERDGECDG